MVEYISDPETGIIAEDILSQILSSTPSVVYSILMLIMNTKYLHLANYLTGECFGENL